MSYILIIFLCIEVLKPNVLLSWPYDDGVMVSIQVSVYCDSSSNLIRIDDFFYFALIVEVHKKLISFIDFNDFLSLAESIAQKKIFITHNCGKTVELSCQELHTRAVHSPSECFIVVFI